jgi:hypothetical protein
MIDGMGWERIDYTSGWQAVIVLLIRVISARLRFVITSTQCLGQIRR